VTVVICPKKQKPVNTLSLSLSLHTITHTHIHTQRERERERKKETYTHIIHAHMYTYIQEAAGGRTLAREGQKNIYRKNYFTGKKFLYRKQLVDTPLPEKGKKQKAAIAPAAQVDQ